MTTDSNYKYYAFISYNAKDIDWGKKLQKKLERFKIPAALRNEHGWKRKPINPVFFAPTDIQPGGLTEELQERLKASKNLVVICSPNSAKSEWVGKEIEFFHDLGRTKNIHFFIVDGIPHSGDPKTECFNPVIDKLGLPEILGANINEKIYRWPWLNKERANGPELFEQYKEQEEKIIVKNIEKNESTALFTINKEDHTFGNAVKMMLLRNPKVRYVAYRKPHPLEDKIEIKIQTNGDISPLNALREALKNLNDDIDDCLEQLNDEMQIGMKSSGMF